MPVPVETYLGRITPWQSGHPRFVGTVTAVLQPICDAQVVVSGMPSAFDLETAIGTQLDVVGEWVGRSRDVPLPIIGAYFSLDVAGLGLDQGAWREAYSTGSTIYRIDDETYRRLLQANIVAKRWDGTVPEAQRAFDAFFVDPDTRVFVQDNAQVPYPVAFFALDDASRGLDEARWYDGSTQVATTGKVDVSMTIGVAGKMPPPIYLGLMAQGAIPIKPGGVETTYAIASVDETSVFGLDVQNEYIAGLDLGSLGVSPSYLLSI